MKLLELIVSEVDPNKLSDDDQVLLGSYVFEREARPVLLKLVSDHEPLLRDYLNLTAPERAQLEILRERKPEYLEGDFDCEPAFVLTKKPKGVSEKVFEFYRTVHTQKAVSRIVEKYINHNPQRRQGPVPLKNWFASYDFITGRNLREMKDRVQYYKTGRGIKYYSQWRILNKKRKSVDFEYWVESQLTDDLKARLRQTPYYQERRVTIEQVVKEYIKNQPENLRGPVSITTWFISYDIKTGENLRKQQTGRRNTKTGTGSIYYSQWYRLSSQGKYSDSFSAWLISQLKDNSLRVQLESRIKEYEN